VTRVLVATDSVHTTAAACDYLSDRGTADAVRMLAVVGDDLDERDAGDALNVAAARLPAAETRTREGDRAGEILGAAEEFGADELVLGARSGDPDDRADGLGTTAAAVLAEAGRPVVVLPA